jgi:hypothetical protein
MVDEKSNPGFDVEAFKREMLEEISQTVSKITNAAITQRFTSFEAKLNDKFAPTQQEPDEKDAASDKPRFTKEKNSEFMALKSKIDKMEQEKQQLVARERDANLRKSLAAELTKAGVDPRFMKAAIATLIDSDKLVSYTSSEYEENKDKIVFRAQDGEEELPRGLNNWVKSDEGKNFVAPKGDKTYKVLNSNTNSEDAAKNNLLTAISRLRNG